MTNRLPAARRLIGRTAIIVALLGLPGCGGLDGIEFNGRVFEAVGLTGSLGKRAEPKTEPRAPLVLPPPTERLPEPGALAAAAPPPAQQANQSWPNDPDKAKAANDAAKKQAQAQYCRDGNWRERAMGDDIKAAAGPDGSCNGSIFTLLSKQLFGE